MALQVEKVLSTIRTMQLDDGNSKNPPYLFQRDTTAVRVLSLFDLSSPPSLSQATDSLMMYGRGPSTKLTGLSRSLFRPSDDATTFQYNIPGNAMMCSELNHLHSMLSTVNSQTYEALLTKTQAIIDTLCVSLEDLITASSASGNAEDLHYQVLPYEIDGFGSEFFMDDANVPSLLALPVLGYMSPTHPVYLATRRFVLSASNPYFYSGSQAEGIGGPHIGYGYAWPMAIVQRAMTSSSDEEIKECLSMLVRSAKSTGFMHEAFNVNNVNDFTRYPYLPFPLSHILSRSTETGSPGRMDCLVSLSFSSWLTSLTCWWLLRISLRLKLWSRRLSP
jgi:meiotically up-regulated gene 157 (Mug157) protein